MKPRTGKGLVTKLKKNGFVGSRSHILTTMCSNCHTMILVNTCRTCGIQTAECDCGAVYISVGNKRLPITPVSRLRHDG